MSGIETVMTVLEEHGYERRPRPLEVARTKFDFEAAAVGTNRSHDLVLIAGKEIAPNRLLRMVTSVARGLDIAESRRPMTVVLVRPAAIPAKSELEAMARVLTVSADATRDQAANALAVLLPLRAAVGREQRERDPLDEVRDEVRVWNPDFDQFIKAARHGQAAVEEALSRYVNHGANPASEGRSTNE